MITIPLQVASQPVSNSSCRRTRSPNTFSKKFRDVFKFPVLRTQCKALNLSAGECCAAKSEKLVQSGIFIYQPGIFEKPFTQLELYIN